MKKRIYVDLDNTLCDFYKHMINYAKILYGRSIKALDKNVALRSILAKNWFIFSSGNSDVVTKEVQGRVEFWETMPFKDKYAKKVFEMLDKKHDVFISTAGSFVQTNGVSVPEASLVGKMGWIKKNLPFFDLTKTIFCKYKYLLLGDYIIDDLPRAVDGFEGKIVLVDYEHNRKAKSDHRVNDWLEIKNIFFKEK